MKYITGLIYYIFPIIVYAETGAIGSGGLNSPIKVKSFEAVVAAVLSVVSAVGAVLVVLAIIYAGFLFVTAQGNSDKIESAKKIFLWTVVGAIVLLGAGALSKIVAETAKQLK